MYHSYYAKLKTGLIKYPLSVVTFPPKYLPEVPCAKEFGCPKGTFSFPPEIWKNPKILEMYKTWYMNRLDSWGLDKILSIIRKYYPEPIPIEEITFMSYTVEPDQRGYICEWLSNHGYPSGEFKFEDLR